MKRKDSWRCPRFKLGCRATEKKYIIFIYPEDWRIGFHRIVETYPSTYTLLHRRRQQLRVRFQFLTAITMNITILWDMAQRSWQVMKCRREAFSPDGSNNWNYPVFKTKRSYIAEDSNLHNYHCENLKSRTRYHTLASFKYNNKGRTLKKRKSGRQIAVHVRLPDPFWRQVPE
jgi:hypothetical protein